MKALSVKQPWATLIVKGVPIFKSNGDKVEFAGLFVKDIENRNWRIGRKPAPGMLYVNYSLKFPERIYIHASKVPDDFEDCAEYLGKLGIAPIGIMTLFSKQYSPTGAIIGEVDITACVTESKSPWFVGPYGFLLANPKAYDKPIPCRGQLGFFEPEIKIEVI